MTRDRPFSEDSSAQLSHSRSSTLHTRTFTSTPHSTMPPTSKISAARKSKWRALADDTEKVKQLKADADASIWWDGGAPSTVRHRERVKADFESFMLEVHQLEGDDQVWRNKEIIIDMCKQYLGGLAKVSKGLLEEKSKAGVM
jgi:hypothetical protein